MILIGFYVVFAIVAPWSAMFAVYGRTDAWSLIGFYSHLFWFPVLFGTVQFIFLTRLLPMLMDSPARKLLWRVGLPFSLIAVLLGGFIQSTERPALFELRPGYLHEGIREMAGTTATTDVTRIQHLTNPASENCAKFEESLPKNSWQIPNPDRSFTQIVCGISIILQIFVWTWTALAFCWAARLIAVGDDRHRQKRKVFIATMLWTLILSLPWFAMRKVFEKYLSQAYTNLQVPNAVIPLGIIFLLGGIFLAVATWQIVGERVNSAVGLASTLGISGLFFKDDWLEAVFPRTPSVSHFILLLLVVAFVLIILLVRMPEKVSSLRQNRDRNVGLQNAKPSNIHR